MTTCSYIFYQNQFFIMFLAEHFPPTWNALPSRVFMLLNAYDQGRSWDRFPSILGPLRGEDHGLCLWPCSVDPTRLHVFTREVFGRDALSFTRVVGLFRAWPWSLFQTRCFLQNDKWARIHMYVDASTPIHTHTGKHCKSSHWGTQWAFIYREM